MTSVLVCLWLKISSCTRLLYFLPHKSAFPWEAVRHNKNPSVTLSIFNRMKVLIKAVCCVAPSLAQPWHATMGSAIWLAICQHRSTRRGGGEGSCAPRVPLCSTESVPDGCDLWTSQNGGTNERHSTCVWDGGTVFGHHSVFEEGVSDIASQVLMGGESAVDAG